MVYGRKRYYRRNYRWRKGNLSNYSIATRTNARSQAKQIYGLKKRIDSIQRRTKPEIKVWTQDADTVTNTSSDQQSYIWVNNTGMASLDGSFARLLNCNGYFNASYTSITNTIQPVSFRIVMCQTKASRSQDVQPNDVFNLTSATSSGPLANNLANRAFFGPLKAGCARTVKILCDRKYYLSYQRPQISSNIKLNKLMNYYIQKTSPDPPTETIPKGRIYVFVLAYTPQSTGTPTYQFDMNTKIAFTDA